MGKAYGKYILALLLFGTNGIVASYIALNSYEIVFLRSMIGSMLLLAIFLLMKYKFSLLKYKKQAAFLITSGVAMGANWMFLYEAYQEVGVSIGSLLCYCGPIIVMALSPLLFRERWTQTKTVSFLVVIAGILLVNGKIGQIEANRWGLFCGAMSAVMYAVLVIFNKKAAPISGLENALVQLMAAFATVAVFMGIKQGFAIDMTGVDLIPILVLGLLNTGIGCYLYFSAMGKLPVQTVAICGYLEPLSAVVFSVLILHETMTPLQMLGGLMILSGAMVAEWVGKVKQSKNSSTKQTVCS